MVAFNYCRLIDVWPVTALAPSEAEIVKFELVSECMFAFNYVGVNLALAYVKAHCCWWKNSWNGRNQMKAIHVAIWNISWLSEIWIILLLDDTLKEYLTNHMHIQPFLAYLLIWYHSMTWQTKIALIYPVKSFVLLAEYNCQFKANYVMEHRHSIDPLILIDVVLIWKAKCLTEILLLHLWLWVLNFKSKLWKHHLNGSYYHLAQTYALFNFPCRFGSGGGVGGHYCLP